MALRMLSTISKVAPKLYNEDLSPACRAVQLTAKLLNVPLEKVHVNIFKLQQLSPEFVKLNPTHTVPVLVESDGFTITDSNAICGYLVDTYGKTDALYPKDVRQRTKINQILYFNNGIVYNRLKDMILKLYVHKHKTIDRVDKAAIDEAYNWLEAYLGEQKYLAGDDVTIADVLLAESLNHCRIFVPLDKHAQLLQWYKRCEQIPHFDEVNRGIGETVVKLLNKLGVQLDSNL